MSETLNQVRRSLAMRGVVGTLHLCAVNVLGKFSSAARRVEAQRQEADAAFDREWGVDTGGIIRPDKAEVQSENWCYGIRYQAVDPTALIETLRNLSVKHEDFTFVDYGSGKGRALIIAASFPFRRIIGVEYCADLNRVARENLSRMPAHAQRCSNIEIVHADATLLPVPDGPLVLYFFNPFARPVMERVVENVAASYRANPRRMVVIYFTPYEAELWAKTGIFKKLQDAPAIFDTQ